MNNPLPLTLKWLSKAYPTEAEHTQPDHAIQHSLTKWEHLRPEILVAHGLRPRRSGIIEIATGETILFTSDDTCALCHHHLRYLNDAAPCITCPLYILRDGYRCDDALPAEESSPYEHFLTTGDPEPMIELLRAALTSQTNSTQPTPSLP